MPGPVAGHKGIYQTSAIVSSFLVLFPRGRSREGPKGIQYHSRRSCKDGTAISPGRYCLLRGKKMHGFDAEGNGEPESGSPPSVLFRASLMRCRGSLFPKGPGEGR
jgi:hypothetical protein